jgi:uncharacterized protein YebE (UPF0316 family)
MLTISHYKIPYYLERLYICCNDDLNNLFLIMQLLSFLDSSLFNWLVLPLLIFMSRLSDVTLATLRHIFVSKGLKRVVPIIGFFEVLIWLIAMRQIMSQVDNVVYYIAWAAGFSAGTLLGMWIEERLALGQQVIRIITNQDTSELQAALSNADFGLTILAGHGSKGGEVKVLFMVIKRKEFNDVTQLIHEYMPNAFYSVEDVRSYHAGVFHTAGQKRSTVSKLFLGSK